MLFDPVNTNSCLEMKLYSRCQRAQFVIIDVNPCGVARSPLCLHNKWFDNKCYTLCLHIVNLTKQF